MIQFAVIIDKIGSQSINIIIYDILLAIMIIQFYTSTICFFHSLEMTLFGDSFHLSVLLCVTPLHNWDNIFHLDTMTTPFAIGMIFSTLSSLAFKGHANWHQ